MMRTSRRVACGMAGALMVSWGLGCGDEPPPPTTSSEEKATVTGTVTVDGKKINRGTVNFDPANISRKMAPVASAKIEGGKYKVETLVGPNTIAVDSPEMKRGAGTSFDVKSGSNEFNIDLHLSR